MIRCEKCGYRGTEVRADDCPHHVERETERAMAKHKKETRGAVKRTRPMVFALRLTDSELADLRKVSGRMGVNMSDALRALLEREARQ